MARSSSIERVVLPISAAEPADGEDGHDFGMHGSFDSSASDFSAQGWLTQKGVSPTVVNLGAAVVAGVKMVAADPKAFFTALRARPS